jgi:hypothetical protein
MVAPYVEDGALSVVFKVPPPQGEQAAVAVLAAFKKFPEAQTTDERVPYDPVGAVV